MRTCRTCLQTKALREFYKDASKSDGLMTKCKHCDREKSSEYYRKNRLVILEKYRSPKVKLQRKIARELRLLAQESLLE